MIRKTICAIFLIAIMGMTVYAGQFIHNEDILDIKLETDAGLKLNNDDELKQQGYWSKVEYEETKYITNLTVLKAEVKKATAVKKVTTAKNTTIKRTTTKKAVVYSKIPSNASRAEKIIAYAKSFLGVPYAYGGESPSGFDCSGYVQYVLKKFNINLGRTATAQYNNSTKIKRSELKPGDLVFFSTNGSTISHDGIYLGNNKFIHASSPGDVVKITQMASGYYDRYYYGAGRY